MDEASHLGIGYCRGTTGSNHFTKSVFHDVEHSGFETIISVKVARLKRVLKSRPDILNDLGL